MATKGRRIEPTNQKMSRKEIIRQIVGKTPRKKFLSESQKEYYETLIKNEITIC